MKGLRNAAALARSLGDPLRLLVMERLLRGAATVAELTALAGASQSKVSNHLAVLRRQRLVRSRREGRQQLYELAGEDIAELVETLLSAGGRPRPASQHRVSTNLLVARTCYDHLAGRLGVDIFDALVSMGAITRANIQGGQVKLGSNGPSVLERLGVDLDVAVESHRKFAYACVDWTERRSHLGGALGALVCQRFLAAGWIKKRRVDRSVVITDKGSQALRKHLGIVIPGRESGRG